MLAGLGVVAAVVGTILVEDADPTVEIDAGVIVEPTLGLTIDLPDGWSSLPLVTRLQPAEVLVVGTADRPPGEPIASCTGLADERRPPTRSAYVTLYEYQATDPLRSPDGFAIYEPSSFAPRPADFGTRRELAWSCPSPTESPVMPDLITGESPTAPTSAPTDPSTTTTTSPVPPVPVLSDHSNEIAFTDGGGRWFLARIVSVDDPTRDLFDQAHAILNSLVVSDPTAPTTSTTTIPGFDGEAATQQVLDAINASMGTPTPTPSELSVEGNHPFADPAAAEAAAEVAKNADPLTRESYEGALEGKLAATINWIVFDSPTYARLNFDVFNDGQLATANTTGYAVFEDGFWRIGRATFCEIAMRGGVSCS